VEDVHGEALFEDCWKTGGKLLFKCVPEFRPGGSKTHETAAGLEAQALESPHHHHRLDFGGLLAVPLPVDLRGDSEVPLVRRVVEPLHEVPQPLSLLNKPQDLGSLLVPQLLGSFLGGFLGLVGAANQGWGFRGGDLAKTGMALASILSVNC